MYSFKEKSEMKTSRGISALKEYQEKADFAPL